MVKLARAWAHGVVHLPITGLAGALVLGAGACTLLFDPGRLDPGGNESVDARPGSEGELALTMLSPAMLDEGMGVMRRVPVVITGQNIAQDAKVRLTGPGQDGTEQPLVVAADGELAAFELAIAVQEDEPDISTKPIQVEVIQGDETGSLMLAVDWLDELVATEFGPSRNFTFMTDGLKTKYSRIALDAPMKAEGGVPLRLLATTELVLSAPLSADGGDGGVDLAGVAGPGGCGGGALSQAGGCMPGGGSGAEPGTGGGGGGGGHAGTGTMSASTGGGDGGGPTGTEAMTDLKAEQGNGGGGGSGGSGKGGGGGGGGGVIELVSLGTFRIETGAGISVRGGSGGGCMGASGNGGGGGGSGGAILLRSALPIEDRAGANILVLDGGQGGQGSACTGQGGEGAPGRARVDAPALPSATSSAAPYHGAVLDLETPSIVRTSTLRVTVLGQAGQTYSVASPMTAPRAVELDDMGRGTQDVMLTSGINRVCALVQQSNERLGDGENCLDVAYVP